MTTAKPTLAGDPSFREKIAGMLVGSTVTQLVYVAAKLGIPDLLAAGPLTTEEICAKTGANRRALGGMLRAMAAMEILSEDSSGRYSASAIGEFLRGWRSHALLLGEEYYRATGNLLHTALTGESAFAQTFGMDFYEYMTRNEEAGARFNEVMIMNAPARYADVTTAFDFSRARNLIDVGGGHGGLTSIVLRANPELRSTVFDAPDVIAGAKSYMDRQGLAGRYDLVAGDFFQSVPAGGDIYLLSSVITNWDDARAGRILRNCRAAMAPAADLVLVEYAMLPGRKYSASIAIAAVAALTIQGSITRTEAEYRAMLAQAGLRIETIRPLNYEPYVLIHATPV